MNINNIEEIKEQVSNNICLATTKILENNINNINYNCKYDMTNNQIMINFNMPSVNYYKEYETNIKYKLNGKITSTKCNCVTYKFSSICEHVLAGISIIKEEENAILKNLNIEKYSENPIIETLKSNKHQLLNLKINLVKESIRKEIGYYEVNLQIGDNTYYVLKKNINEFFESYYEGKENVLFGKNFIYNPDIAYFNEFDKQIIELLPLILTQKNNYNDNLYNIDSNYLSTYSYKAKMLFDILKKTSKSFTLTLDEINYDIAKIDTEYNPIVNITQEEDFKVSMDTSKIIVLTSDYSYILEDNKVYYLDYEKRKTLKCLIDNKKFKLKNTEKEEFDKYVLPKMTHLSKNIKFSSNLDKKYNIEKPIIKLYFDYQVDRIICNIKAFYKDMQINVLDDNIKYNDIIISRSFTEEIEAIKFLNNLHFKENIKEKVLEMFDEEDIVEFIEDKIYKIKEYEIFITDNLSKTKIIKNPVIKSSFSLEKGELLKCNLTIDGIPKEEIENIMEMINYKKKYYKLKNGDILYLEDNKELINLDKMINTLDIEYKNLNNDELIIPKYKAFYINNKLQDNNFISLDNELKKFINNYQSSINKQITIEQPKNAILRDYQELGIKWLLTIANTQFGGILADEMGLGKTLQTIMYIQKRLKEDNLREILIVCPTSLIYNWENEFKKFAPNIKVKVIADLRKKREKIFEELEKYEVFITSYGLLKEDIDKYKQIKYDTFIIDEAQTIKNTSAIITKTVKTINADIKFALTGTPLENSLLELYSIFDFIMPGFFGSQNNFLRKYGELLKDINDPIKKDFLFLINPFILRRRKKDVIKELPDKIENNLYIELYDEQKKLYISELNKIKDSVKKSMRDNSFSKNKLMILQSLTRLRQICISPSLCVENYNGNNAKIDTLIETIESATLEQHKILIFSTFTSALNIIRKKLIEKNIKYYYLDGSTKSAERINLVNKFNKDKTPVFLLSLKAGGNGLNLVGADIVIHLDPWWNPAVENQATSRAHRIGQKNVVEVIKLIAKGTIEEKILKLQNLKINLSNEIIEGESRDKLVLNELNEDDLLYILENE